MVNWWRDAWRVAYVSTPRDKQSHWFWRLVGLWFLHVGMISNVSE
jgi:hypothetical protein